VANMRPASAFSTICSTFLARHSRIDMTVPAKGDLHIDHHHTTEDVGTRSRGRETGARRHEGITRYASLHMPMDEALTRVAIDISGRRFWCSKASSRATGRHLDTELVPSGSRPSRSMPASPARRDTVWHQRPHISSRVSRGWRRALRARSRSIPARRRNPVDQGNAGCISESEAFAFLT